MSCCRMAAACLIQRTLPGGWTVAAPVARGRRWPVHDAPSAFFNVATPPGREELVNALTRLLVALMRPQSADRRQDAEQADSERKGGAT